MFVDTLTLWAKTFNGFGESGFGRWNNSLQPPGFDLDMAIKSSMSLVSTLLIANLMFKHCESLSRTFSTEIISSERIFKSEKSEVSEGLPLTKTTFPSSIRLPYDL